METGSLPPRWSEYARRLPCSLEDLKGPAAGKVELPLHVVEELVSTQHGDRYLRERQARAELKQVNRELKQHRAQLAALEERRSALLAELGEQAVRKPG